MITWTLQVCLGWQLKTETWAWGGFPLADWLLQLWLEPAAAALVSGALLSGGPGNGEKNGDMGIPAPCTGLSALRLLL